FAALALHHIERADGQAWIRRQRLGQWRNIKSPRRDGVGKRCAHEHEHAWHDKPHGYSFPTREFAQALAAFPFGKKPFLRSSDTRVRPLGMASLSLIACSSARFAFSLPRNASLKSDKSAAASS